MSDLVLIAVKTPADMGALNLDLTTGEGGLTKIIRENSTIRFIHTVPGDKSRIRELVSTECTPDYRLAYPFNPKKSIEENEKIAEKIAKRILDTLGVEIEYAVMCVSGIGYEKSWRPVAGYSPFPDSVCMKGT